MAVKITHYDQGDIWTPQATFTVGGTPTDPTNVTVKIKDPAGTITTVGPVSGSTGGSGITRVGPGVFKYSVPLTAQGYWFSRFEGTGAAAATEDQEAIVDPSEFFAPLDPRALVGLAETKDWLNQQNVDTSNDLELARIINDVSDRLHQEAEREFKANGTNPATRTFEVPEIGLRRPRYIDGDYVGDLNINRRRVAIGDLTSFTAVQILDTDWTTVLASPATNLVTGRPMVRKPWEPITELEFHPTVITLSAGMRIAVTGTWGFPAVPGNIRQAALDAIAAIYDRDVEHYRQDLSETGQSAGEGGTTVIMAGGSQRLLTLPAASIAAAWSYREVNLG